MIRSFVISLVLILGYTQTGWTQITPWLLVDSNFANYSGMVELGTGIGYRSNVFDNQAMEKVLWGGLIDEDHISDMAGDLKNNNRFGGTAGGGLLAHWRPAGGVLKSNFGLQLSVENYNDIAFEFSEHFYKLVFQGNKQFAGQRVNGTATGIYQAYQKLGFGLYDSKSMSGFRIAYVNGQQLADASATFSMLTTLNGDTLDIDYRFDSYNSPEGNSSVGSNNGHGIALDFDWNIQIDEGQGYIGISGKDLGFVNWSNQTKRVKGDSSWVFTGVDLNQLLDEDNLELNLRDSLQINESTGKYNTLLPGAVAMHYVHRTGNAGMYQFGVDFRLSSIYIPAFHAAYMHQIKEGELIGVRGTYGGYGRFRVGANYEKWFENDWMFRIGTSDLAGLVLDGIKGRSGYIAIRKMIGRDVK